MGLFDKLITLPKKFPPQRNPPPKVIDDFDFIIQEVINGVPATRTDQILFLGGDSKPQNFLPYGGVQRVVKDFYPGNSEPVMHIMGSQESEIRLTGRFKDKFLAVAQEGASLEKTKLLDAFRIRGNLIQLTWGDFRRFAILKETKFNLKTTRDIDYELVFDILGFSPPTNCKVLDRRDVPFTINALLAQANSEFKASVFETGITLDQNIFDELNGLINDAAAAIAVVTDFVDQVVGIAEQAQRTVNRAIGVVNNALASVSKFETRLRSLTFASFAKFKIGASTFERATRRSYSAANQLKLRGLAAIRLRSLLLSLRSSLAAIAASTPQARHLVQQGDTLQKLAFKFFNDSSQWIKIKEHNKLEDTTLVPNQIIEIPR